MALTAKQQRFVSAYLIDPNATKAAVSAGYHPKMAAKLVAKGSIAQAIATAQKAREQRTAITQDAVLQRLWMIATADPNEIVEYRRTCCRHCWGKGYLYQRTANEMERDRQHHAKLVAEHAADSKKSNPGAFNEQGGAGYDARKPPNVDCQECFGDGVGQTVVKDTRSLSPSAKALYAGVKQTKDGIEARLNDQHAALINVAKHLGMFEETVKLKGSELPDFSHMTPDELDAALALIEPLFAKVTSGGTASRPGANANAG